MRTITHSFNCVDGHHTITIDVFKMSGAEAVDVYGLPQFPYGVGGHRVEALLNGVPRGTRFYANQLGAAYIGDTDDGRAACEDVLAAARRDGFLPPVGRA